ncbi:MAG: RsbRD N-terminal domain-containing protein, partial [Aurantimonas coralicida]|nr:RsbRD N-terminal domain-containing protein [Aurantimonas coralicida]
MASETTTASLLQDEFEKILSAWLKAQAKEGVKRTDLVSAKETERQSRDLLTALARSSQTAATDASFDFANPGWDPVRDAIEEITESRTQRGVTPS